MTSTIDPQEINAFEKIAGTWWDPKGPFRPLHMLNPVRLQYICNISNRYFRQETNDETNVLNTLKILDAGCGGGLVSEGLARLGANVTAIDAGQQAIQIATEHARQQGLSIDYRCGNVELLLGEENRFDIVTALEIVEHVSDVDHFTAILGRLVRPGGLLILSTLNKTFLSRVLAITVAEHILKWAPPGTHQWEKFLKPSDLARSLGKAGLSPCEIRGLSFNPFTQSWKITHNTSINYFMTAIRSHD